MIKTKTLVTTRAQVLEQKDSPLVLKELGLIPPKSREVMVRMTGAGLCRSDLNGISGHTRYNMPLVLGHEGVGIVEEIGPEVTTVKAGDRVILSWAAYCGDCFFCNKGLTHQCHTIAWPRGKGLAYDWTTRFIDDGKEVFHFNGVSSFSERTIVHETGCVGIGSEITNEAASVIGCSVVTGVGAVFNTAAFPEGDTAVVIGSGSVGLSVVQALRIRGAAAIILVEPDSAKWDGAKRLGATHTLSNRDAEPVEAVMELTGGFGVDYAFDCVAEASTMAGAFAMVRRGGTAVVVGSPHPLKKVELPQVDFHLEKRIMGSLYGSSNPQRDLPGIAALVESGEFSLDGFTQGSYRFEDLNSAIEALKTNGGKYSITFQGG